MNIWCECMNESWAALARGVLQCVAVCCSLLQCVAVCCSVLRVIVRIYGEYMNVWCSVSVCTIGMSSSSHVCVRVFERESERKRERERESV